MCGARPTQLDKITKLKAEAQQQAALKAADEKAAEASKKQKYKQMNQLALLTRPGVCTLACLRPAKRVGFIPRDCKCFTPLVVGRMGKSD